MADMHKKFATKTLAIKEIVNLEKQKAVLAQIIGFRNQEIKRLKLENDALRTACELMKELQTRLDSVKFKIAQLEADNVGRN